MRGGEAPGRCRDCALWIDSCYCAIKPLFTRTRPDRLCDEAALGGRPFFIHTTLKRD